MEVLHGTSAGFRQPRTDLTGYWLRQTRVYWASSKRHSGQYFSIKDPAGNWVQCRHHYFSPQNSPSAEKGRSEAEWQLANTSNENSAASGVQQFGCGFFMTEGGIEGKAETPADKAARLAGVQAVVNICEERGYGWCLWAQGDWADGFGTYGAQLKTRATYPSITAKPAE